MTMTKSEARAVADRMKKAQETLIDLQIEVRGAPDKVPMNLASRLNEALTERYLVNAMACAELERGK
jgi:hypothetical protein